MWSGEDDVAEVWCENLVGLVNLMKFVGKKARMNIKSCKHIGRLM